MPQTGYTPIQTYSSSTPGAVPSASSLTNDTKGSELGINIADKNLFFKDSSNVVNTVPIRQSGTSSNGWLSSTDWNTFNNKQPAGAYLTSVTADSPLSGAGTSASHLVIAQATTSTSGYLSSTDWNTFNNKQPAGTYVTSVTGTAPVVSSGGTTPAISMAAATTSVNGYLTSTDWNTFNGKQAALVSGTNIKTVNGTTLLGSGDLGTIGIGYGGTGLTSFTANGILYASSTSALATSSTFTWNGNTLSVDAGTTATAYIFNSNNSTYGLDCSYKYSGSQIGSIGSAKGIDGTQPITDFGFNGNNNIIFATGYTARMKLFSSGGVSIGNTTDPGATNLSVTGNTKTDGLVSHAGTGGAYQSNKFNFQWTGSAALWVDTTNIGNIAIVSDIRLKNILGDLKGSLARVMQWQTVLYEYNGMHDLWPSDGNIYAGFIAGQLADITPSAVNGVKEAMTSDGKIQPQTLNPIPMLAELTNALQEQQTQIEQLKAEIAALKG